ncbi:MAG: alkene reductase [Bryobacteraceae bacterium]
MDLFSPFKLGPLELPNRMVMSALTRCRAVAGNVPNPLAITYYTQRATAGLILTEATQVTPMGQGYPNTPGIYSAEQVEGWKKITDAVHQAGGRIFLQLWHVGRVSLPEFHGGELPVSASALPVVGKLHTPQFQEKQIVTPRALETSEIPGVVQQFKKRAENAKAAGFDGVEIHGANGYLLEQFLKDGTNHRADQYGGSLENRMRFPLEVVDAVVSVWGGDRVGYRISPHFDHYSMSDSDPVATYSAFIPELNKRKLALLDVVEGISGPRKPKPGATLVTPIARKHFKQALMVNGGYDAALGKDAIEKGSADLVCYGTLFLANPDLPERFKKNASLNAADSSTFYGGGEKGYTDYPALA